MNMPTQIQSINQAIHQSRSDARKEWFSRRLLWSIQSIVFSSNQTCDSAFFFRDWTLFRTNPSPGLTYQRPTYLEQLNLFLADPTSQSTNQPLQSVLNKTPLWIFFLRAKGERKCEGMFVFLLSLCAISLNKEAVCVREPKEKTLSLIPPFLTDVLKKFANASKFCPCIRIRRFHRHFRHDFRHFPSKIPGILYIEQFINGKAQQTHAAHGEKRAPAESAQRQCAATLHAPFHRARRDSLGKRRGIPFLGHRHGGSEAR